MYAEKPTSLAEAVTGRLRREIVEGDFDFGDALSESKIAKRYAVSRTPVREAFARLEHEGLVRTEPQFGTFVFTMDRGQFAQISETRSVLEVAALRFSMARAHEGLVSDWRLAIEAMTAAREASDAKFYSSSDGAFHEALFDRAGNPYLDAARRTFSAKMAAIRNRMGGTPEHMDKSYGEHVELLELVESNDVDGASALLERHITQKGASFWSVPEVTPKTRWERLTELAG